MTRQKDYKKTLTACYLGFVTQAISANFTPLLFLTFKGTYGISLEKIALIPVTFYLTQLLVDMAAAKFADKIGYRLCVLSGFVIGRLAVPDHSAGFAVGTVDWNFDRGGSLCCRKRFDRSSVKSHC